MEVFKTKSEIKKQYQNSMITICLLNQDRDQESWCSFVKIDQLKTQHIQQMVKIRKVYIEGLVCLFKGKEQIIEW